jgi:hypothetical protein
MSKRVCKVLQFKIRGELIAFGVALFLLFWFGFLVYIAAVEPGLSAKSLYDSTPAGVKVSDFLIFYRAGRMLASEDAAKIYDIEAQLKWTNEIIQPAHVNGVLPAVYPPTFLVATILLAPFTPQIAYFVWILASILFLTASFICVLARRPEFKRWDKAILILSFLASAPAIISLRLGQPTWFLVGLFALFWCAAAANRNLFAGVLLAFSTMKPQYAVFALVPTVIRRKWTILFSTTVTELVLLIIATLKITVAGMISYPASLVVSESHYSKLGYVGSLISLREFHRGLLSPQGSFLVCSATSALGLILTIALWWKVKREDIELKNRWAFALTMMLALGTSPHAFIQDCLLVPLVACLTLPCLSLIKIAALKSNALKLYTLALITYPILSWWTYVAAADGRMIGLIAYQTTILVLGLTVYFRDEIA